MGLNVDRGLQRATFEKAPPRLKPSSSRCRKGSLPRCRPRKPVGPRRDYVAAGPERAKTVRLQAKEAAEKKENENSAEVVTFLELSLALIAVVVMLVQSFLSGK